MLGDSFTSLFILKYFRFLSPIRAIPHFKQMNLLLTALISSLPLLMDTFIIILFFYSLCAISGVQLFSGFLTNRCFHLELGIVNPSEDGLFCGNVECESGYGCGKGIENSYNDQIHFDDFFSAVLMVF